MKAPTSSKLSFHFHYIYIFIPFSKQAKEPSTYVRTILRIFLKGIPWSSSAMARAHGRLLAWAYCMVLVSAIINPPVHVLSAALPGLGANWGTMSSHPIDPSIIVKLLKDNGIGRVKLFDADSWTVNALAGSGIEVMLGIPNDQLKRIAKDYDQAKSWVEKNCTKHLKDVKIKYVAVGNEPFLSSYNGSFVKDTLPAMKNIQKALDEKGIGEKIKATTPLNADVYEGTKPSNGQFRKDINKEILEIVKFLHENKCPFLVNIYPFISLYQNPNFPFEYAFFDGLSNETVQDNNIVYQNVFDANFDTLVWTLKKAGFSDMKIMVGEVGWPTDGYIYSTPKLAKKFYDGLLKKLAADKGTPLRPGRMDVYIFSLIDEDQKSILPGAFERHWGLFRYDGQPKFPMDLTGKGNDKMLIAAKEVQYQDKQWCVVKPDGIDASTAGDIVGYACANSDCSSLAVGGSCSKLDRQGTSSYAVNMIFQANDQDVEKCDFKGMAHIVKEDPSRGDCFFPVQIESGGDRHKFAYGTSSIAAAIVLVVLVLM